MPICDFVFEFQIMFPFTIMSQKKWAWQPQFILANFYTVLIHVMDNYCFDSCNWPMQLQEATTVLIHFLTNCIESCNWFIQRSTAVLIHFFWLPVLNHAIDSCNDLLLYWFTLLFHCIDSCNDLSLHWFTQLFHCIELCNWFMQWTITGFKTCNCERNMNTGNID